ncbi:FGGY family carbohydrate kinase, partial [Planctomycetota bacterium]
EGVLTTVACDEKGQPVYALEGSVFIGGAALQWLRDGLSIIETAAASEELANSVRDTGGVYFVPAFVGLGAPYWDMDARGAILGLTRGTERAHVARAALEAICYQSRDLLEALEAAGLQIEALRVDGGACANDFLVQFQADILGRNVIRPANTETTALGAAILAGLGTGFWDSFEQVESVLHQGRRVFEPQMAGEKRENLYAGWKTAVARVLTQK